MLPSAQDIRFALRTLRKTPATTAVILISLAIGIGANTAIFSVVNGLLLRPLPWPHADRLALLWLRSPGLGIPQDWPSPGEYLDLKAQNHVFEQMAICHGNSMILSGRGQPERVDVIETSSSLLDMLGGRAMLGRTLLPEEDTPGKPPVAVLMYGSWKRLFGGDPAIVGRTVILHDKPYTVAGVLSPDFVLNSEAIPTVAGIDKPDMFLPLPLGADAAQKRRDENYNILVRIRPGVSVAAAQADVDVIARRIREQDHRDRTFTISVVPVFEQIVGDVRRPLLVLLGSVTLVLLIACANVANLLLSRATARRKETVVRAALGAGRGRLVTQLLTESVLLGLFGGIAGLAIAFAGLFVLRTMNPGNIPRLDSIAIDARVLGFTFAVSLLTGIVFGVAPALRASRVDLNATLKLGGRTGQSDAGLAIRWQSLRGWLVISEVALSLMLLIGAGLLIRSFIRLGRVSPGFNPDHVISMRMMFPVSSYHDDQAVARFHRDLETRLAHVPGIVSVGEVSALPLTAQVGWGGLSVEGYTPPPNEPELQTDMRIATTDYFRTMQIPLVRGRFFSEHDSAGAQKTVLIDEKLARRFWPHADPVGRHLKPGTDPKNPWWTVIGVVGLVRQYGLDQDTRMVVYFPEPQVPIRGLYMVARTGPDPASMAGTITREVHSLDPNVPVYDVSTMEERLHASLARRRFSMTMLGAFAGFALILAAVGIYGVISYLVTQTTHDIGVRLALGAQQSSIVRLVMRQGGALAGAGIAAGLIGALALTRVMASLLFGVGARDAVTFSAVAIFLAAIALLASYLPARRAARVDPIDALRYE